METDIKQICDSLIFEPVCCVGNGNQMQVASTKHKNVQIIERTFFPWNVFKKSSVHYMVDLVLPMGTEPCLSEDYYTDEGFGVPVVDTLEEAVILAEKYLSLN